MPISFRGAVICVELERPTHTHKMDSFFQALSILDEDKKTNGRLEYCLSLCVYF